MDDLLIVTLALLGSIVSFLARPLELEHWVHVKAAHPELEPLSLPLTLPGSESLPPPESEQASDPAPAPGLVTA